MCGRKLKQNRKQEQELLKEALTTITLTGDISDVASEHSHIASIMNRIE